MNPDKTEAIVIGTDARQRAEGSAGTLDLKCVSVKLATSVRSLGVRIDNTLSFNEQCRQRLQVFPLPPEGVASHSEAHLSRHRKDDRLFNG